MSPRSYHATGHLRHQPLSPRSDHAARDGDRQPPLRDHAPKQGPRHSYRACVTEPAPSHAPGVHGGDLSTCVDDTELDYFIHPLTQGFSASLVVLPARLYSDATRLPSSATELRARLRLGHDHVCLFPVHTRHHWALGLVYKSASVVMDSAPSPATRRDWFRQFADLGLPRPIVATPTQQHRGSLECGLHVILNALRVARYAAADLDTLIDGIVSAPSRLVSLASWRPALTALKRDRRPRDVRDARVISEALLSGNLQPIYDTASPPASSYRHDPYKPVAPSTAISTHVVAPTTALSLIGSDCNHHGTRTDTNSQHAARHIQVPTEPQASRAAGPESSAIIRGGADSLHDLGRPLPGAHVRRWLAQQPIGSPVMVDFAYDGERTRWWGHLTQRGRQPRIMFVAALCAACSAWHPLDDESPYDVPFPGSSYFELRASGQPLIVPPCAVSDSDDSDESVASLHELAHDPTASNPAEIQPEVEVPIRTTDPDMLPLGDLPSTDASAFSARAARTWWIYEKRPPHVHAMSWSRVSPATRKAHIKWLLRIKHADDAILRMPLPSAVVELVTRHAAERSWSWSTIASSLATAAAAVRALPLYCNVTRGFELKRCPIFAEAYTTAIRRSKIAATHPKLSSPLPFDQFQRVLAGLSSPGAWLLLALAWHFAARVGDLRQITSAAVSMQPSNNLGVPTAILFTAGKGAAMWGPYTIHSVLPENVAQRLTEQLRRASPGAPLFTTSDQAQISAAIRHVPGCSLRSVRKGALTWFAEAGVSDESLQLVSGHRRRDTLLRYLGWGLRSSEAERAAQARAAAVASHPPTTISGGDIVTERHPMWVGPYSGSRPAKGRRVAAPRSRSHSRCHGSTYSTSRRRIQQLGRYTSNHSAASWTGDRCCPSFHTRTCTLPLSLPKHGSRPPHYTASRGPLCGSVRSPMLDSPELRVRLSSPPEKSGHFTGQYGRPAKHSRSHNITRNG